MPCTKFLERKVLKSLIKDLLANHFLVTVNNGEEDVLVLSNSPRDILAACCSTDYDKLIVRRTGKNLNGDFPDCYGWILLIYGNSGYDTINDYTTNLEASLVRTMALIDEMQA
jgi:hypothetical protein